MPSSNLQRHVCSETLIHIKHTPLKIEIILKVKIIKLFIIKFFFVTHQTV